MSKTTGGVMGKAVRLVVVGLLGVLFSILVLPACVIKLGKGGVGGEEEWGSGGATGVGGAAGEAGAGGSGGSDVEDYSAFAAADQDELALRAVTAAYAANVTASLVEEQLADPESADPAVVEQLIEEYAPAGWDAALAWVSSVDLSALEVAKGVIPNSMCLDEPYICRPKTWCPFAEGNVRCAVTQCGTGKCPWCPFGGNLIFKSWCAYGCVRESDGEVVGGAFILLTIFNNYNGPFCIKF